MKRSIGFLDDRAREIAASIGYTAPPFDSARGLGINNAIIRYIGDKDRTASRWSGLGNGPASVMLFWRRESPQPLIPLGNEWNVTLGNPPRTVPGMLRLTLDDVGRLVFLEAEPPLSDRHITPAKIPPWNALFAAAGLDIARFKAVDPIWIPRTHGTEWVAWEGTIADRPDVTLRVEASAYRGVPVSFRTLGPWTPPEQPPGPPAARRFSQVAPIVMLDVLLLGTLILARFNLRAGRGDRRGAGRLFFFTLTVWIAAWIVGARHYRAFDIEDDRFFVFLPNAIFNTAMLWLFYIALEPYVRRFVPRILISSTRVLSGQVVDPRVGRDLLLGITVGIAMVLLGFASMVIPGLLGEPPSTPRMTNLQFLMGGSATVAAVLRMIPNALQTATALAVAFAFGRALLRNTVGASVLAGAVLAVFVFGSASWERPYITVLSVLCYVAPMIATLVYGGLLAGATAFFVSQMLNNAPLTLDMSRPHVAGAMWPMLLVLGLALFGFYASRKGQPFFGRWLQTD